jgi:hypothetical protein
MARERFTAEMIGSVRVALPETQANYLVLYGTAVTQEHCVFISLGGEELGTKCPHKALPDVGLVVVQWPGGRGPRNTGEIDITITVTDHEERPLTRRRARIVVVAAADLPHRGYGRAAARAPAGAAEGEWNVLLGEEFITLPAVAGEASYFTVTGTGFNPDVGEQYRASVEYMKADDTTGKVNCTARAISSTQVVVRWPGRDIEEGHGRGVTGEIDVTIAVDDSENTAVKKRARVMLTKQLPTP